jgi:hypothetical protein
MNSSRFGFRQSATSLLDKAASSLAINYMEGLPTELGKQSLRAVEGKEVNSIDKILTAPLSDVANLGSKDFFGNKLYWLMFQKNINLGIRYPNRF